MYRPSPRRQAPQAQEIMSLALASESPCLRLGIDRGSGLDYTHVNVISLALSLASRVMALVLRAVASALRFMALALQFSPGLRLHH
jgi:hypothetical protein